MAGTEYLRAMTAVIQSQDKSYYLSENFAGALTWTALTDCGVAGTLALVNTAPLPFSGAYCMRIQGQDATGAGNTKYVSARKNLLPRNPAAARFRLLIRWNIATLQADFDYLLIRLFYYDGTNNSIVEYRAYSQLGVSNVFQYRNAGAAWVTIPEFTQQWPSGAWSEGLYFETEFVVDFGAALLQRIRQNNVQVETIRAAGVRVVPSATVPPVYTLDITFGLDADNAAHEVYVDEVIFQELG